MKTSTEGELQLLTIKDTRAGDSGSYKCVAENDSGSASCVSELLVREVSRPEFKERLKPTDAVEGEDAVLRVCLTGFPNPQVEWLRGTDKIVSEGRFEISPADKDHYFCLIIRSVEPRDAGLYKCVASNKEGKVTCRAELSVKDRVFGPEFSEGTDETPVTVREGEEASLAVTIKGNPKPTVTWYKDGQRLRETSRLDVKTRGNRHFVSILVVAVGDSGIYRCEASSKLGSVSKSFRLVVESK